jgi:signal transduction histidine kinase
MTKKKKFGKSSLFVKIIILFFTGHMLFGISQWNLRDYFFRHFHAERIQKTADNYADLIIDKIGNPPDTLKAAEYARKFGINVRIETDSYDWSTGNNTPDFDDLDIPLYKKRQDTHIGFDEGLHVITKRAGTRYLISIEKPDEDFVFYDHLFFFISFSIFTIIIYLMYIILKKLLYPLKQLREGVEKVGQGDFEYQIITKRKDELGKLVRSFNNMKNDVREMIKSREQLILDVSHELRTPLTRTKLALEFLEDSDSKNNIKEDIREIEFMVAEILETERLTSKHGGIKNEMVILNDILETITFEFANREPGIELIANDTIAMKGDSDRLKTLFRNIADNALKYSSNQSEPVRIELNSDKKNVEIICTDHGEGIPENELKYIFEPFYRVDKSRSKETGGYGLGMHLAKKIVEAHSGTISIKSKPAEGTTIKILFPKNN